MAVIFRCYQNFFGQGTKTRNTFRRRSDDDPKTASNTQNDPSRLRNRAAGSLSSEDSDDDDVASTSLDEQHLFCLTPSKMMLAFGVLLAMLLISVLAAATFCIRSRRLPPGTYAELPNRGGGRFLGGGAVTPASMGGIRVASALGGGPRPPSAIPTPAYAHVIKPGSPYFRVMR
jgi:hypothetical protein